MTDTEAQWALECLQKADKLVIGRMKREIWTADCHTKQCLLQASTEISGAIESLMDAEVDSEKVA